MRGQAIAPWLPLLALAAAQAPQAAPQATVAPDATAGDAIGQSPQEMIQHKLQLVHLLTKSPALERAARSDDAAVKQQVAAVRTLYAKAGDALSAGEAAQAEKFLDEALRLIASTSRLAPDPLLAEAEQRALRRTVGGRAGFPGHASGHLRSPVAEKRTGAGRRRRSRPHPRLDGASPDIRAHRPPPGSQQAAGVGA